MFLSFIIFIILLVIVLKTLGFAIWCIKDKNIIGGISVILLTFLVAGSGFILLK